MKKRILVISFVLLFVVIAVAAFLYSADYIGRRPFKNLDAASIESASVFASPPQTTAAINDQDTITALVDILRRVTIYKQDDSGREMSGQLVRYTITLKTGETYEIGAFGSFMYVGDVCYKAKYGPSEELNALGNRIIKQ